MGEEEEGATGKANADEVGHRRGGCRLRAGGGGRRVSATTHIRLGAIWWSGEEWRVALQFGFMAFV